MTCNLEQRLLDNLKSKGLIKETRSGIKYTGSSSSFRPQLGSAIAELRRETPNLPRISSEIMMVNDSGIILVNPTLLEEANEKMGVIDTDSNVTPSMEFSGSTAAQTLLDEKLKNPNMDEYVNNRKFLLRSFTRTRNNLLFKARSSNLTSDGYISVMKEVEKLNMEIDHLQEQINTVKSKKKSSFVLLNADKDFKKIEDFLNGREYINYSDIEELLSFYKRLGSYENNPLIPREEMYLEDGELNPESAQLVEEIFGPMKTRIDQLEAKIEAKRKEIAMAVISNNSAYRELFADSPKTFDELLYLADGLPDTSLLDAYFMDITNGIIGSNGIIPQIMQMQLDSKMEEYSVYTRRLQMELSKVVPEVEKELKRLGKSWDIFLLRAASGLRQDGIISPINSSFYRALYNIEEEYRSSDITSRKMQKARKSIMQAAAAKKRNWVRANCLVLDINNIPELNDNPTPAMEDYKNSIIAEYGETVYNNAVENQAKKIDDYKRREAFLVEELLSENKVKDESSLPEKAQKKLYFFREENNPKSANTLFKYNELIPRKTVKDIDGSIHDTGFINESFSEVENNPILMKFYDILSRNQELMLSMLPPDKQKSLGKLGLVRVEKTFWDFLSDPSLSILEKVSKFFAEVLNFLRTSVRKDVRSFITKIKTDPKTGRRKYKVNDAWFTTNKEVINDRYAEYELKIKKALGISPTYNFKMLINVDMTQHPVLLSIFSELLGVPPLASEISKKLGVDVTNVRLSSALYDAISDQVISEQSIDLPRMLMLQMHQVTAYVARTEAMPHIELLKKYYTGIRTAEGKERTNGIKQIESWFNRVVLDNYENNNELDALDEKYLKDNIKYTKADKERLKELDEIKEMLLDERDKYPEDAKEFWYLQAKIEDIDKRRKGVGYVYSISNMGKRFLEAIRFKALGYNINSNITNYAEGQISNFLAGEAGIYFNSEQLKRANFITLRNNANTLTLGLTGRDKKVTRLMKKFNVQQDATNEFQKATKESSFDKLKKVGPYEFTTRTEFLNQSPVMVAMLLNEPIKGKNGQESNVWDALNEDGTLKEEFRTEENIATWELNESEQYRRWKSKINKAIIDIHGDYHDTHGNMASEFFLGKVFLMFKRWMIRMIYARFGAEQIDLESGQLQAKGRYRSMTKGQLILYTGVVGAIFSPMFGVLGLGIGVTSSFFLGKNTDMGIIQDLLTNVKALAWNILRLPVNKAAFFTDKEIMKFADMDYADMELRDINNLKANISELTIFVLMATTLALFKSMLASALEDEDEEEWKKFMLTYLINKNMQLLSQASLYVNPVNTYKGMFSEMGLIKHIDDIIKFTDDVNAVMNGEEKDLWKNGSKVMFMPSIIRNDWLGLEGQAHKVYEEWGYDALFEDVDKKSKREVKIIKDRYKESIEEMDIPESEKKKKLKELDKAFRKRTKESQEQRLERIESRKEEFNKKFTD